MYETANDVISRKSDRGFLVHRYLPFVFCRFDIVSKHWRSIYFDYQGKLKTGNGVTIGFLTTLPTPDLVWSPIEIIYLSLTVQTLVDLVNFVASSCAKGLTFGFFLVDGKIPLNKIRERWNVSKTLPWIIPHSLSIWAWKSVQHFDMRRGEEELTRKAHSRTLRATPSGQYSNILRTFADNTKIFNRTKFLNWSERGINFTGGYRK